MVGLQNMYAQQLESASLWRQAQFLSNPAMTGANNIWQSGAIYDQRWIGFENAPRTIRAFTSFPLTDYNMGLGGSFVNDVTGPLSFTGLSINYSYHLDLGLFRDDRLSLGLMASMYSFSFDADKVIVTDPSDPIALRQSSSGFSPNFGFGFFYASNIDMYEYGGNGFFFGAASDQLLSTDLVLEGSANIQRALHANAIIGARFVSEFVFVEPRLTFNYSDPGIIEGTLSVLLEKEDALWAGVNFTFDKTFYLQGGVIIPEIFSNDDNLRIGAVGGFHVGQFSEDRGVSYQFLVAYDYKLF